MIAVGTKSTADHPNVGWSQKDEEKEINKRELGCFKNQQQRSWRVFEEDRERERERKKEN